MRRLALLFAGGAVWLFLFAIPALADNGPHHMGQSATTDSCAGCHRAHTAKAPFLLKDSQVNLCYTCHGTNGLGATTDVQDGVQYQASDSDPSGVTTPGTVNSVTRGTAVAGALRGGGFDYALIDTHLTGTGSVAPTDSGPTNGTISFLSAGEATTSSHSVDGSAQMAWGYGQINATVNVGTSVNLTCASCHDPHGNGNYRILKDQPDDAYAGTYTFDPTKVDVTIGPIAIADATTKVYTTTNYWDPSDANAPEFVNKINGWCAQCHTRYAAWSNSQTTTAGDAVFMYRHSTPGGSSQFPVGNTRNGSSRTCVKCHVVHGSNATMGTNSQSVPWPGGTSGRGLDSGLLRIDSRGVCQACHQK